MFSNGLKTTNVQDYKNYKKICYCTFSIMGARNLRLTILIVIYEHFCLPLGVSLKSKIHTVQKLYAMEQQYKYKLRRDN